MDYILINRINTLSPYLNYGALSYNINIPCEYILKNLDKNWNWERLSNNLHIIDIEKNINLPWNFKYVSENKSLTIDFVIKHKHKEWDWAVLSNFFNLNIIKTHNELPWCYKGLSANTSISFDYVLSNLDKPWDWKSLSMNKMILLEHITSTPFLKWDWKSISFNPNLTFDFLFLHINKPWNWEYLSMHPNITIEHIKKFSYLPWDWYFVCMNNNFTLQDIIDNKNKLYLSIFNHKWLTFDFIKNELKNINLNWYRISRHKCVTPDNVEFNPDLEWDYNSLASNPNLTFDFIRRNLDKPWDWDNICANSSFLQFRHTDTDVIQHCAALTIQKAWFKANTNPKHSICQRRLYKEFNALKLKKY